MKKNKKKIWKLLIQGFVYLAMLGVFAGFVVFLNRSAQTETEDVMDWEPEAAQGIPEGWELAAENQAFELYFEPSAVQFMVKDKTGGQRPAPERRGGAIGRFSRPGLETGANLPLSTP